jgi:hypothetical protein
MAYEMNAEGINGVQQTTIIAVNVGGGGWTEPPPAVPGENNLNAVLFVSAQSGGGITPTLTALHCMGNESGPGVIGQATGPFGLDEGGVGVAGFSQLGNDPTAVMALAVKQTAGVFGQCDGGPGVKGQGGHAQNPPTQDGQSDKPIVAGTGVIGMGGAATAAKTEILTAGMPKTFPALPGGAGVVGAAGDAKIPHTVFPGNGVVGMGSPAQHKMNPGLGVVGMGGGEPIFSYEEFPNAGVMGQGGKANPRDNAAAGDTGIVAGVGVVGWGGGAAFTTLRGNTAKGEQTATAGAGVVGLAGDALMPVLPSPPAATAGVVGIGSPPQPDLDTPLMGGAGVLGLAAGLSFPVGEVVTNGPGVVGIGAQFQPKVGAGRGGVFGSASNVAQIQLLPSLVARPLPEFGSFGDLYLALIGPNAVMFLCVGENLPASPGPPALWAPFILGATQSGGSPPVVPPTFP